jgi:hypothetical protein
MNTVHLHLLMNHLPVVGTVIGALLLALALLRRSDELARISLGLFGLLGLVAVLVYLTGEPAEDAIEKLPGISDSLIDRHQDAALVATILVGAIGALALASLLIYRRRALPRWVTVLGFGAALVASSGMAYTANLGGQIRHTEIRSGTPLSNERAAGADVERERGEH